MDEKGFTAFISYRHQSPDMVIAQKLHTAIETYRIPANIRKKTGRIKMGRVFRDQEELPLSSDLGKDIEDALDRSEWFIAVCSPRYLESRWCMRELEYFIEKKGRSRVLTILVEGEPRDSFPGALQFRVDESGNLQPVEPLAADVRGATMAESLKKLKGEKLRLLAPILGVTYDDLRLRERQRRRKRLAAGTASVLVLGGILAVILIRNADLRHKAEEQRIAALEQQRIAEEERKRAEDQERIAGEERERAEEEQRRAEEERKRAEEQQRKAEEERQRAEEERQRAEEEQRKAEEERQRAEEEQRKAEVERQRAEEQQRKAEEERQRAEEQQRKAEEERLKAVSNSIGEALQTAGSYRTNSDNRQAAATLLDALALSEANGGMRREDIISQLRRTMYIEPFAVVSRMNLQNGRLNNAQVSADGKKAICIVNSKAVALFDLEASEMAYAVSKGSGEITYIAFSPDGSRFVALCDNYHCATVWNTEDGSEVYTYTSETNETANALFWKGSDTLLIQDHDRLFLVSLPDGEITPFYTIGEQQDGYDYGNTLYTFMGGNRPIDEIITDYADRYSLEPLIISQDGTKVLVTGLAGKTGTIILNDRGERISLLDRAPAVFADYYGMSPDGRYAACQFRMFGYVCVWETETGRLRHMKKLDRSVTNGASAPVFSPDSEKVAFLSEKSLYILDAAKGKELARTEVEWEDPVPMILNWSSDGKYLMFFSPDLYIVDAETGEVLLFLDADDNLLYNNVIPVGSDYVFATQGGGEAILLSLPGIASVTVQEEYTGGIAGYDPRVEPDVPWTEEPLSGHQVTETFKALNEMDDYEPVLYYSPGGEYAALLYPDGAIEVFRKGEGEKAFLLNTQFYNEPTAFGIFGSKMVAADSYGRIMFQDLTDSSMSILDAAGIYRVFMFEGNYLAAGRNNGAVVDVFDTEKGERLFTMQSPAGFTRIGFSEDGEYAVGLTEGNGAITGELWQNENALLEAARRFAPGH